MSNRGYIPSPSTNAKIADPWWQSRPPSTARPRSFSPSWEIGTAYVPKGGKNVLVANTVEASDPVAIPPGFTGTPCYRSEDLLILDETEQIAPLSFGPHSAFTVNGAGKQYPDRASFLSQIWLDQGRGPTDHGELVTSLYRGHIITDVAALIAALPDDTNRELCRLADPSGAIPDGFVYATAKVPAGVWWRRTIYQLFHPDLPLPPPRDVQLVYDPNTEGLTLHGLLTARASSGWYLDVCSVQGRVILGGAGLAGAPLPPHPTPLTGGVTLRPR